MAAATRNTEEMNDATTKPLTGSATTTIIAPISEVYAAVTDVTRMGEWSPECTACRWIGDASGPAVGAEFAGDNVAALGPITLKRWTTTSKVIDAEPNVSFEFIAEGYSTWQKWVYGRLLNRQEAMTKGMQLTLDRIKQSLER